MVHCYIAFCITDHGRGMGFGPWLILPAVCVPSQMRCVE